MGDPTARAFDLFLFLKLSQLKKKPKIPQSAEWGALAREPQGTRQLANEKYTQVEYLNYRASQAVGIK